jgi:hypothetical protein
MQVMDPDMFNNYRGYENGEADVVQRFDDGRTIVKTPNVLKTVRAHFNCTRMLGAELEDDGGSGSRSSHWEERIFEVRPSSHNLYVLFDLKLPHHSGCIILQ